MNKNTFKIILNWLPITIFSVALIAMGLAVGLNNREWQIENGYTPMNNDWPLVIQYICYWVVMMFGWVAAIPLIWVAVGPHDYYGDY